MGRNRKIKLAIVAMAAAVYMFGCGSAAEDTPSSKAVEEETGSSADQDAAGPDEEAEEVKGKENAGQPAGVEDGENVNGSGAQDGKTDGQQTVNGMVKDVGDKHFIMELLVSGMDEDSGLVLVGGDPDGATAEVNYTEDTVFTRRVTTDGETSTIQPGSPEDIKTDALVYVTGIWSGDVLQAEEVEIFVYAPN